MAPYTIIDDEKIAMPQVTGQKQLWTPDFGLLITMVIQILWFVFAGFLLGFILSTIWEWLYFRRIRLHLRDQRIVALENEIRRLEAASLEAATDAQRWHESRPTPDYLRADSYIGPGVLLENEQAGTAKITQAGADRPPPARRHAMPTPFKTAGVNVATDESDDDMDVAEDAELDDIRYRDETNSLRADVVPFEDETDDVDMRLSLSSFLDLDRDEAELLESADSPAVIPTADLLATTAPTAATAFKPLSAGSTDEDEDANDHEDEVPLSLRPTLPVLKPAVPRRSQGYPDDLALIDGVSEQYKQRLYQSGIFTWSQIANGDVEKLRHAAKAKADDNVEEWPIYAQELAQKHDRVGATYYGPPPDDLTEIPGIDPTYANDLYRAGICTFQQLASARPNELQEILIAPAVGDAFNFNQWLRAAANLARQKQQVT